MGPKRRIALVVGAVTLGVAALPSGALALGENGGTETVKLNMPANGMGQASTDKLPAKVTQADITVTPISDERFFGSLRAVMEGHGGPGPATFGDRIEQCIFLTEGFAKDPNFFPGYQVQGRTLQILFLSACLQLALEVSVAQGPPGAAHDAAAGCFTTPAVVGVNVSHSGSGYAAKVSQPAHPRKLRTNFKLSCQRTRTGLKIKIRPRKRGQKLRSTVGPTLPIGFVNPSGHAVGLKIAFTVK